MPNLSIKSLINHLETIDMNLGIIWGECQNYEILEGLERERKHLCQIIDTLKNLLEYQASSSVHSKICAHSPPS